MAQVYLAQRGHRAGERGSAASADTHVPLGVLRALPLPVELVIPLGHCAAQLPDTGNGSVLLIVHPDLHLMHSRRRAGERAGLRLALPQVAPIWVAVTEATPGRLRHDVDDPGEGDG